MKQQIWQVFSTCQKHPSLATWNKQELRSPKQSDMYTDFEAFTIVRLQTHLEKN